jgi:hypothetical protein
MSTKHKDMQILFLFTLIGHFQIQMQEEFPFLNIFNKIRVEKKVVATKCEVALS